MTQKYLNLLPFFFIGLLQNSFAQPYQDCVNPLKICNQPALYVETISGVGTVDSDIDNSCVLAEHNATWLTWTIEHAGMLTFEITTGGEDDDIDFVIFQLDDDGDCETKQLIRCMASGENTGQPFPDWEPCWGPTGLAVGETDTIEYAGCTPGDNNFLAPLNTAIGDTYVMLVNDYYNSADGFTIEFGGTAVLDCTVMVSTEDPFAENKAPQLLVYPTLSQGLVSVEINAPGLLGGTLLIYNSLGQKVHTLASLDPEISQLDLRHLSAGSYIATLNHRNITLSQQFIISK